ncbi:hypothetical protein HY993_00135 [Candidatus Micrarchaeota archaeon]|nr:hypothetical protein [Candidatus Micrarchaeota archaeon]
MRIGWLLVNVSIGLPYESIISKVIQRGYAGNQTEVIRQALLAYERVIDEEEVQLVNKGIQFEMQEINQGKVKTKTLEQIKKKYGL